MSWLWIILATALGLIGFSARYKWWRPAIAKEHPRIFMYHMVREHIDGARFNGLRVPPAAFDKQLSYLHQHGWQFWFLSELLSATSIPEKVAVITFDDGYEDNYTQALPLLKKYHAKATLFLVEQRQDNDWSTKKKAHHDSGELMREPKLSDEQVHAMIASGLIEIGGHSMTHADFSKLTLEQKKSEITESRALQIAKFPDSHKSYAYTFGIYDQQDVELVKASHYLGAVTTVEGISEDIDTERFELRRVKVAGKKDFLHFKLSLRIGLSAFLPNRDKQ